MEAEGFGDRPAGPAKHAAIPEKIPGVEEPPRRFDIRFLAELNHVADTLAQIAPRRAGLDVAESRVGAGRRNAEGDQPARGFGGATGQVDLGKKNVGGRDYMIRRENGHRGVAETFFDNDRGQRHARRRVARHRLDDDILRREPRAEAVQDRFAQMLARDDENPLRGNQRRDPLDGFREHGLASAETKHLFGPKPTAVRPEPLARPSGHDDGDAIALGNCHDSNLRNDKTANAVAMVLPAPVENRKAQLRRPPPLRLPPLLCRTPNEVSGSQPRQQPQDMPRR